jgi:hypothetical protein
MGVFPKKPIVNFSLNKEDILSNAVDHDDAQRGEPIRLQLCRIKFIA